LKFLNFLNSVAVLFLILAFSSAIGAYGPSLYDFDCIPEGAALELRRVMLDSVNLVPKRIQKHPKAC